MKSVLVCLAGLIAISAAIESGYYHVESYCSSIPCPRTTSNFGSTMACPKNGENNAYWERDSTGNVQLQIKTYNIWPLPDGLVQIDFNINGNWNTGLNAAIIPTYGQSIYYYVLPCSVTFNSYQATYYGRYCQDKKGYFDNRRVFVTKGIFDAQMSFYPQTECNFVLSEV